MKPLSRVQVYLDSSQVDLVDRLAAAIKISRSQIVRDAVEAVANRYVSVAEHMKENKENNRQLWSSLAGTVMSTSGDLGQRVDEIYHDRT